MTEYLPIIAMGAFGLVIAVASHFSLSRERKALLDARARLAEMEAAKPATGSKAASVREHSLSGMVQRARVARSATGAPKQYRRSRGKL